MRTKHTNETHLTTEQRLTLALSAVDEPLRTELYNFFWLSTNPIEFARELISLELPLDTTRELLLCKVSQPPKRNGEGLEVLLDKAMQDYWKSLGEEHGNVATL